MDYHSLNAMLNLYDADGKIQFDADKRAAREYFLQHVNQNTVFFHSLKERLDYLVEKEYYEPAVLEKYPFEFIQKLNDLRVLEEVPLRDVPRRVQVLHELHAQDLRRQALPRALRGPRRDDRPRSRRRRPEARDRPRRRDHLRPLPAGDADVPQLRQGAARRARLVLPAAHRRQHGVDLARHQLRPCSCPSAAAASRCCSSNIRESGAPIKQIENQSSRHHPRDEAARRQLQLRQPARCPPGRRRGVPARAPPRHHAVPRHQARERRREDPHQDALARRRHPRHHVRARQERRGHVPVLAVRRRAGLRRAVRRHLGHREVPRDGRRRAHQEDEDQRARVLPDARRDPVRVGLPVHHVRGHGEPGQPDQGPDQHVEPVQRDPAGQHADDVQRGPLVQGDRQGHLVQPRLDEHRAVDGCRDLGKTVETAIRALTRGQRPEPHRVGPLDRGRQRPLARDRPRPDEPARLPRPRARALRLRRGPRLHEHLLLHGAVPRAARVEQPRDRARRARSTASRTRRTRPASSSTSTSTRRGSPRPRRSRSCSPACTSRRRRTGPR